jgi:hypothetical protein
MLENILNLSPILTKLFPFSIFFFKKNLKFLKKISENPQYKYLDAFLNKTS